MNVTVQNSGTRLGDEVVQMYVQHVGSAVERPIKQLLGFKRITLKPGESQTVQTSSADLRLNKTIEVSGN